MISELTEYTWGKVANFCREKNQKIVPSAVLFLAVALIAPVGCNNAPQKQTNCDETKTGKDVCQVIAERTIVDAARTPWSAIGRVRGRNASTSHCSGTLIGEARVLTAAHCVFNTGSKEWIDASDLVFEAGYQDGTSVARSTVDHYEVERSFLPPVGTYSLDPERDWAILTLSEPIGKVAGYLKSAPLPVVGSRFGRMSEFHVAGYARASPEHLRIHGGCHAEAEKGNRVRISGCPLVSGDSGGPLLVVADFELRVVGVLNAASGKVGYARLFQSPVESPGASSDDATESRLPN